VTHEIETLVLKTDVRGSLFEVVRGIPEGAQTYVFSINGGHSRGGHWHRRKIEWFTCVGGECQLLLNGDEGKAPTEKVHLMAGAPVSVKVFPGTKHTFFSEDNVATILACISESFDESDPDTFFDR